MGCVASRTSGERPFVFLGGPRGRCQEKAIVLLRKAKVPFFHPDIPEDAWAQNAQNAPSDVTSRKDRAHFILHVLDESSSNAALFDAVVDKPSYNNVIVASYGRCTFASGGFLGPGGKMYRNWPMKLIVKDIASNFKNVRVRGRVAVPELALGRPYFAELHHGVARLV